MNEPLHQYQENEWVSVDGVIVTYMYTGCVYVTVCVVRQHSAGTIRHDLIQWPKLVEGRLLLVDISSNLLCELPKLPYLRQ